MSQEDKAEILLMLQKFTQRKSPKKNPIQAEKASGTQLGPNNTGDDAKSASANPAPAVITDNADPIQDEKASGTQLSPSNTGDGAKSASANPAPAVITDNADRKNATGGDKKVDAEAGDVQSSTSNACSAGESGNGKSTSTSPHNGTSKKESLPQAKTDNHPDTINLVDGHDNTAVSIKSTSKILGDDGKCKNTSRHPAPTAKNTKSKSASIFINEDHSAVAGSHLFPENLGGDDKGEKSNSAPILTDKCIISADGGADKKSKKVTTHAPRSSMVRIPFQIPNGKWELIKFDIDLCRQVTSKRFDVLVVMNSEIITRTSGGRYVERCNS